MSTKPTKKLDVFENPASKRDYLIEIKIPEFTCLCPKTGQPDFAEMTLAYIPAEKCIELKALKLYIWSFRDQGAFHEAITNSILDDIVEACSPRFARLSARFNVRGGTYPTIIVEHRQTSWEPSDSSYLPNI
ncbi:MAG: NADPH-dependent 7-cyano-7-deazaguanine reductase QueF [Proteobacteria bacterium]|jgi:7-cyano-7-deazaguanine reductase|nr:NADPH-dependent 7-cyano-7-deazaguanine reductase QueF [Pseudomonadota bacterium]MBT5064957.1 NADPH-dependent 7-cyano-7-deazaguanine reductase QueF [Pseudomonadota bacterium]MBT6193068.1 NADPH-dependent 7-cyano-7-deazaguanine reductase QueF [Pseudomonadota bacterium]MBT6464188.1 NADPH-dependent 7-cyano-7-deazaguanine reductase QueF [Pseudomonadota bacterium]MBT6673980.1 NADPH-dependent 7-cyano-7-deazaguanine reductase QueF [Pseudomonadota bacterium]